MHRMLYIKIGLLSLLIITGFVGYQFFHTQLNSKEQVLGKKTQLEETQPSVEDLKTSLQRMLDDATKVAQKTVGEVSQTAGNAVSSTTTHTVETVKEYIYDRTVGSALQQINNLPKEEKEKIKEYICK